MPSSKARASTKGLNDDPGCRPLPPPRPPSARFTCDALKSRPPTSAFTKPVWGSTATRDMSSGDEVPESAPAIDFSAAACIAGSIVVSTFRPPRKTIVGPYLATR